MPKRTDNAQHQLSPQGGRGWFNRQIEPGEGALPVLRQSAPVRPQCLSALRGSRNGATGSTAFQGRTFVLHPFRPNAARHPLRQSVSLRRTRSLRCSGQAEPACGISRLQAADFSSSATIVVPHRSHCDAARASVLSERFSSPYPSPGHCVTTLSRAGERVKPLDCFDNAQTH